MSAVSRASGEGQRTPWVSVAATVVGFALHLVVGFFYVASGLVVPAPWLPVLWAVWCGFTAAAIARRRQTKFVLLSPVASALFLVVAVSLGGYFLNWTA